MQKLKLGILDQLPIREGGQAIDPVNEAIEIAKLADTWGFSRYWTAQFHGTVSFTSAACRWAFTLTTTGDWQWPTPWRQYARGQRRYRAR